MERENFFTHKKEDALRIKISANNRIIGVPVDQEIYLQENLRKNSQETDQETSRELPLELREFISEANSLLGKFLQKFGLEEVVEITPEHVHWVDPEEDPDFYELYKEDGGHYYSLDGKIVIFEEWNPEKTFTFIKLLIHEMIHMQSFQSVVVNRGVISQRRVGFRVIATKGKGEEDAFTWLNEAITEQLTEWFLSEHSQDFRLLKNIGKEKYDYEEEKKELWKIIDALYKIHKHEIASRQAVFALFSGAALNGRLLPIARLLEKTLGRGSFSRLSRFDNN